MTSVATALSAGGGTAGAALGDNQLTCAQIQAHDSVSRQPSATWGMSNKMNVSALIITKNEEYCLPAALFSLSWCDDIVVVDSFSTDGTKKVCEELDNVATVL